MAGEFVMKVGLLFEYPTVNGGENSILAVARHLRESETNEVELHALAPGGGELEKRLACEHVPHIPFDVFRTGTRRDREDVVAALSTLAAQNGFDLLHANSLSMARVLGAASDQLPCPATGHLRDILKLSGAAMRDLDGNAKLIAVSEATRQFHVERGLTPERVVTIRNGIDADWFSQLALAKCEFDSLAPRNKVREAVRSELGIPSDAFVLLAAGQIGLRKGLDTLAEAAALVSKSRTADSVHVLLVGARFSAKAESVEFEQAVLSRFREAEPDVVLHATGYRNDVPRLMIAADSLVHAARQEPLGRVLLEAAAIGLPIIATDVGGTAEILTDTESALLVPPDQPGRLRDAIVQMKSDVEMRLRLKAAAMENVRAQFTIDRAASSLVETWQSVCGIRPLE